MELNISLFCRAPLYVSVLLLRRFPTALPLHSAGEGRLLCGMPLLIAVQTPRQPYISGNALSALLSLCLWRPCRAARRRYSPGMLVAYIMPVRQHLCNGMATAKNSAL